MLSHLEVALILFLQVVIYIKINNSAKDAIKRENHLKDWLFKSLYAINHKVLLPSEKPKEMISRKAEVTSPEHDPFAEFNGHKSDWF